MSNEEQELRELKERMRRLERQKEISSLKERLANLEGENKPIVPERKQIPQSAGYPGLSGNPINYKPIGENLQDGMKDFSQGLSNLPHIIVGKDKPAINPKQPLVPELFNPKEQELMRNIKKWFIIAGVLVVVGYAAFRILKGVLF